MKNRVRIKSDENVVTNASIEMLGADDEYHDVRAAVTSATFTFKVGEPSRAHLDLIFVDADIEAWRVEANPERLALMARMLRLFGYTVEPPRTP